MRAIAHLLYSGGCAVFWYGTFNHTGDKLMLWWIGASVLFSKAACAFVLTQKQES